MSMLESFAARIRNSTKVIGAGYSNNSQLFAIEIPLKLPTDGLKPIFPSLREEVE